MTTQGTSANASRFATPKSQGPFLTYSGFSDGHTLDAEFCVVDVETTGLDAGAGASIVELAAIRCDAQGNVIDSMSTLIDPGTDDTGAVHIHGITPLMVSGAPTFAEAFPRFAELLSGAIFVAHHAKFDESFVAAEAERAGIVIQRSPGLCTYWMGRDLLTGVTENHKLATLAQHFNLTQGNMHAAYDDAMVVVQLIPQLIELAATQGKTLNFFSELTQHNAGELQVELRSR